MLEIAQWACVCPSLHAAADVLLCFSRVSPSPEGKVFVIDSVSFILSVPFGFSIFSLSPAFLTFGKYLNLSKFSN